MERLVAGNTASLVVTDTTMQGNGGVVYGGDEFVLATAGETAPRADSLRRFAQIDFGAASRHNPDKVGIRRCDSVCASGYNWI